MTMIHDNSVAAERAAYDIAALTVDEGYKLISCAVQPRPIAWVSTVSATGERNLAPFSFFTVASRDPVSVAISIGERCGVAGQVKDTLANLREVGEFVVSIPAVDQIAPVARTAEPVATHIDEFELAGVTECQSRAVDVPGVAGALFCIECRVSVEVPVGADTLVVGEVLAISSRKDLLDDGFHIDTPAAGFLGRLAGPYFTTSVNRVRTPAVDGS